jgi:predicted DNA repair protein MutK
MSGLLALLDDVAAIAKLVASQLDDIAAQAAKASTKSAGVVIPLPALLLLQAVVPWNIVPLLMLGVPTCFEGAEKTWHALTHHKERCAPTHESRASPEDETILVVHFFEESRAHLHAGAWHAG